MVVLALSACGPFPNPAGPSNAHVALTSLPAGDIEVIPDSAHNQLAVSVRVHGVVPNSQHAADIGVGACPGANDGADLQQLAADEHGVASSSTTITQADRFAAGAHVTIRSGPSRTVDPFRNPIICTAVDPRSQDNPIKPAQDASATGSADLSIDRNTRTLTLSLAVDGLYPESNHPVHLHNGRCDFEGPIAYTLPDVKADANGHGSIKTTIPNVAFINAGTWYIQVHQGPALDSPEQAQPLTCGNVG